MPTASSTSGRATGSSRSALSRSTSAFSEDTYRPALDIRRDQITTFVIRLLDYLQGTDCSTDRPLKSTMAGRYDKVRAFSFVPQVTLFAKLATKPGCGR